LITRKPLAAAAALPGVGYLLAAQLILFSIFDPSFASVPNLLNIGLQSSILLLLALPMTLIVMSEGLDLSMGAVLGLAGVVLAMVLVRGGALPIALLAALATGQVFGLVNGLLVVFLGIPPFVATLGMMGVARGIALAATGGQSVVGIGEALPAMYASSWAGLPFSVVVAACAYLLFHWVLY
jgi:ribose transport system permease protein